MARGNRLRAGLCLLIAFGAVAAFGAGEPFRIAIPAEMFPPRGGDLDKQKAFEQAFFALGLDALMPEWSRAEEGSEREAIVDKAADRMVSLAATWETVRSKLPFAGEKQSAPDRREIKSAIRELFRAKGRAELLLYLCLQAMGVYDHPIEVSFFPSAETAARAVREKKADAVLADGASAARANLDRTDSGLEPYGLLSNLSGAEEGQKHYLVLAPESPLLSQIAGGEALKNLKEAMSLQGPMDGSEVERRIALLGKAIDNSEDIASFRGLGDPEQELEKELATELERSAHDPARQNFLRLAFRHTLEASVLQLSDKGMRKLVDAIEKNPTTIELSDKSQPALLQSLFGKFRTGGADRLFSKVTGGTSVHALAYRKLDPKSFACIATAEELAKYQSLLDVDFGARLVVIELKGAPMKTPPRALWVARDGLSPALRNFLTARKGLRTEIPQINRCLQEVPKSFAGQLAGYRQSHPSNITRLEPRAPSPGPAGAPRRDGVRDHER